MGKCKMHHFTRLKTILRHYVYVVPPYCLSPKSVSIILTTDQIATGSWELVLLHQVLFQIRKAWCFFSYIYIYIYIYTSIHRYSRTHNKSLLGPSQNQFLCFDL